MDRGLNPRNSILQMTMLLWMIYLALTANLEIENLVMGLVVGFGIALLVRPQQLSIDWRRLPAAIWYALRYLGVLILDMVKSGVQVGRLILHPDLPIAPGIVAIDSLAQTPSKGHREMVLPSELSIALSAHAMTLTPGEMVVEMDDQGLLFTHCLEVDKSAQVVAEVQQLRRDLLCKIFE